MQAQERRLIEDHYATLGISPDASREEIKQAYRSLSLQYHPDTASPQDREKPEKFIAINTAYQALIQPEYSEENQSSQAKGWAIHRDRRFSIGQKQKLFWYGAAGLLLVLVVSTLASINIKNKAMLAGLQTAVRPLSAPATPPPPTSVPTPAAAPVSPSPAPETPAAPQEAQEELQTTQTARKDDPSEEPPAQPVQMSDMAWLPATINIAERNETDTDPAAPADPEQPAREPAVIEPPVPQASVAHLSRQHLKKKNTTYHAVPRIVTQAQPADAHAANEKKELQPSIETTIDRFLAAYLSAYQQRDLSRFSSFFAADAVENGKPFISVLPVYKKLFATTSELSLQVEKTAWQQLDGKIALQGKFTLHGQYRDSRKFSGKGPIRFVFLENEGSYQVSRLEYNFNLVH